MVLKSPAQGAAPGRAGPGWRACHRLLRRPDAPSAGRGQRDVMSAPAPAPFAHPAARLKRHRARLRFSLRRCRLNRGLNCAQPDAIALLSRGVSRRHTSAPVRRGPGTRAARRAPRPERVWACPPRGGHGFPRTTTLAPRKTPGCGQHLGSQPFSSRSALLAARVSARRCVHAVLGSRKMPVLPGHYARWRLSRAR